MRSLPAFLFAALLAPLALAADGSDYPASDEGFTPLFNGKDFTGWTKVGGEATYKVEDGAAYGAEGPVIVGEVGPGPNTFLRTDKTYGDFVLKVDLKLVVPGNSGVQFRSRQRPEGHKDAGRVFGYQMEVDPSDRKWSGGIYDEGNRGWLFDLKGKPEAQAAFKLDDWNEYVVKAEGDRIQTWVNGVPVADLRDAEAPDGFIALQVHSGKQGKIVWKDVRVNRLE